MKGCDHCESGWITVKQGYVDRLAPVPPPLESFLAADEMAVEEYDLLVAEVTAKRAALAKTVYPCRDCNRPAFFRWAGGHLEANHDRARCDECCELDRRRKSRTTATPTRDLLNDGPSAPPARADIDGPDLVGF